MLCFGGGRIVHVVVATLVVLVQRTGFNRLGKGCRVSGSLGKEGTLSVIVVVVVVLLFICHVDGKAVFVQVVKRFWKKKEKTRARFVSASIHVAVNTSSLFRVILLLSFLLRFDSFLSLAAFTIEGNRSLQTNGLPTDRQPRFFW